MMKLFFVCLVILVSVFCLPQASAQEKAVEKSLLEKTRRDDLPAKEATAKPLVPKISQPLPFKVGEHLAYDVSFERLIFSGTIGDMKFSVSRGENHPPELLTLTADLVSKGFFPSLFGFKVKDQFSAVINKDDFGLYSSAKLRSEGKTNTEEKNQIHRKDGRVTYTFRDLADKAAAPKVLDNECPNWVQDILSAIYYLRTQEFKQGAVYAIPITDHGQNYVIDAVIGRREEVKVGAGKFQAIKVETKAFSGRLIRKSGELFLWFSDDARRLPIKARVKVNGNTINIELKKILQ
jgi:hypothetical protein